VAVVVGRMGLAYLLEALVAGVGVLVELVKLQQAPLQLVDCQVIILPMVVVLLLVLLDVMVVIKIT
jgi:hypothetical protein